jgi:hypothetical protein
MSFQATNTPANKPANKPPANKPAANNNHQTNQPHQRGDKPFQKQQQPKHKSEQHQNRQQGQGHQKPANAKKIDVTDGNSNFITITIEQYVEGVNSFSLSLDVLDICNELGMRNENYLRAAVDSTFKFLGALRGKFMNKKECDSLNYYEIGIAPMYSQNLRKQIAYIKWMLAASAKHNNFDDEFATYVGMLTGICIYINEMDVKNAVSSGNPKNFTKLCQLYTPDDF